MQNIDNKKLKLEQRKARLLKEEITLKNKERKLKTRNLIEYGGLIIKTELDKLTKDILFGALSTLTTQLKINPEIIHQWQKLGEGLFNAQTKNKSAIILKFDAEPSNGIRTTIRQVGLKYNRIRNEWYGYVEDLENLKIYIKDIQYTLETLNKETV